jgi:hypothetical protein
MKNRMTGLMSYFTSKSKAKKLDRMLNTKLIKAVDTNANGTSGYTVKSGPNKGKVLGHITVKHPNKVFTKSTKDIEAYRNLFDEREWPPKTKFD